VDTIDTQHAQHENEPAPVRVLLAGPDTLYFSFDIHISAEMRATLDAEKHAAQIAATANQVHCPDWLAARVLPNEARGGYSILIETEDFTVKVLGDGIPNRPGLYVELRSLFLHTHYIRIRRGQRERVRRQLPGCARSSSPTRIRRRLRVSSRSVLPSSRGPISILIGRAAIPRS
jgi:hypothetical protein